MIWRLLPVATIFSIRWAWRRTWLRRRLVKNALLGRPIMYRLRLDHGVVVIDRAHAIVAENIIIGTPGSGILIHRDEP